MAQKCQKCGADVLDEYRYCGRCGSSLVPVTLEGLSAWLATLESRLDAQTKLIAQDQRVVEVETAERIEKRLQERLKTFLYWGGIPIGIVVLVLGAVLSVVYVITGSKIENLHDLADQAESRSVELGKQIDSAKSKVAELQISVAPRVEAVQQLERAIKQSQSEVSELQARIAQQSHAVQQLRQQYEVAVTNKNSADVTQIYPVLGGSRVVKGNGIPFIDGKNKKPQDVYLTLLLSIPSPALSNAKAVEEFKDDVVHLETELQSAGVTVFLGGIGLYAVSDSGTSSVGIYWMGENSCAELAKISLPCVMYFRQNLRERVLKLKPLLDTVQPIPDGNVQYVAPGSLLPGQQELVSKSGLDIAVVLGGS